MLSSPQSTRARAHRISADNTASSVIKVNLAVLCTLEVVDHTRRAHDTCKQRRTQRVSAVAVGRSMRLRTHSGPYGSLLPGIILRSTPDSSMRTVRITPPEEPSRAIAWHSAFATNSSHCCAFMPGR